ncbi:MAG: hypothetical protein ACFFDN_22320 [Candidatus Hodarchaeota archaeon]
MKRIILFFLCILAISTGCDIINKPKVLISYKEYNHIRSMMGEASRITTIPPNSMTHLANIKGFKTTVQSMYWMVSPGDTPGNEGLSWKMFPWSIDNAEESGFDFEVIVESHEFEQMKYSYSSSTSFNIQEIWTIIKLGSIKDTVQVKVSGNIQLSSGKSDKSYQSDFDDFRSSAIEKLKAFVEKHQNNK